MTKIKVLFSAEGNPYIVVLFLNLFFVIVMFIFKIVQSLYQLHFDRVISLKN